MTRLAEVKQERDQACRDLSRIELALYDILNERFLAPKRTVNLGVGQKVDVYLTRATDPVVILHYKPGTVTVLPIDTAIAQVTGWSWSLGRSTFLNVLEQLRGIANRW
jgi:hypothetical protein